jgi:hypothetical protein
MNKRRESRRVVLSKDKNNQYCQALTLLRVFLSAPFSSLLEIQLQSRPHRLSSMYRHINILLNSTTANANSANKVPTVIIDRLATREDHEPIVRRLEAPEVVAWAWLRAVVQAV